METKDKFKPIKDFIEFLNKIDFTTSVLSILWGLIVIFCAVFVDYDELVIEIPLFIVVISGVLTAIISVFIKFYYKKDKSDKKRIIAFLSWNAIVPLLYNIAFLGLMDHLYDYSGSFLGGLGQAILRMLIIILSIAFLVIFGIAKLIAKRRKKKGKAFKPEKVHKLKSIINGLVATAVVAALMYFVIAAAFSYVDNAKYQADEKKKQEFRTEMIEKTDTADLSSLNGEIIMSIAVLETLKNGEYVDINRENGNIFKITKVKESVFMDALDDYKTISSYQSSMSFSLAVEYDHIDMYYDPYERCVHVGVYNYCTVDGEPDTVESLVFKYDENWNLIKIYTTDNHILIEKYRQ